MDSAVIAAVIVAGLAGATSLINIILSVINARQSGNIRVIVETRIEYMQMLRKANAVFIGLAKPNVVLQFSKLNNGLYIYPKELVEATGTLKTLLKPFYPVEIRLLTMINSIENNCLALFANDSIIQSDDNITNELETYIKLFTQYDWVLWQFIMKQADGKYKNSNIDFDEVYGETQRNITNTYGYKWI